MASSLRALGVVIFGACALSSCAVFQGAQQKDLVVGDCLDVSSLEFSFEQVPTVACSTPHEAEVYQTVDISDVVATEIEAEGFERCRSQFHDFIGVSYEDSALEITGIYPDPAAQESAETVEDSPATLACVVYEPSGSLGVENTVTGTFRGARR